MANIWKIAPGRNAERWDMCQEKGCILLGWRQLDDYTSFKTQKEILAALGGGEGDGKGAAQSVYRFAYEVQPNDIVVANRGRSRIMGVGIVTGDYLPKGHPDNPSESDGLPHARRVRWVINDPIDMGTFFFGYSTVHSLSNAKIEEIIRAYSHQFPHLKQTIIGLFDDTLGEEDLSKVDQISEKIQSDGQGFASPALRRQIELFAMEAATTYFESNGYTVTDRSRNNPYDLECRKRDEVIYCEVKGTRSLGEQVFLTNGEVEFARANQPNMALFIYHSIMASEDDENIYIEGGQAKVFSPWEVDSGKLAPIAFTYRP